MTTGIDAVGVAKIGVSVVNAGYKNRHLIQDFWTRLKVFLDKGNTQIAICGLPSVGKTVLSDQMHGCGRALAYTEPGESVKAEVHAISIGDWKKVVRVLPGQIGFRGAEEHRSYTNNPDLEGIIFVVDYGYNKPRDPSSQQAYIHIDKITSIENLKEKNLKSEVKILEAELNLIRNNINKNKNPKWIIIAINKIDLYHDKLSDAISHYHPDGSSDFSKALKKFQNEIGSQNINIKIATTCANPSDFEWNGIKLKSQLGKVESDTYLKNFINTVALTSKAHS